MKQEALEALHHLKHGYVTGKDIEVLKTVARDVLEESEKPPPKDGDLLSRQNVQVIISEEIARHTEDNNHEAKDALGEVYRLVHIMPATFKQTAAPPDVRHWYNVFEKPTSKK